MTAPAWLADVRRWSAPPPSWAVEARDRDGHPVSVQARHLLTWLWTLADAPSKRQPGHQRLECDDLMQARIALRFGVTPGTVRVWEAELSSAGLAVRVRGVNAFVLAEVAVWHVERECWVMGAGYLRTAECEACGSVVSSYDDRRNSSGDEMQSVDRRNFDGATDEKPAVHRRKTSGALRKPDQPDLNPTPDRDREERAPAKPTDEQAAAIAWVTGMGASELPEIVTLSQRGTWTGAMVECMRADGLTRDDVEHLVRKLVEAGQSYDVHAMRAAHEGRDGARGIGIPTLAVMWRAWSKTRRWRAEVLAAKREGRAPNLGGSQGRGPSYADRDDALANMERVAKRRERGGQ